MVPRKHRGVLRRHAHDLTEVSHRGATVTDTALKEATYCPHVEKDIADNSKDCLIPYQSQPTNIGYRATTHKTMRLSPCQTMTDRRTTRPQHLPYQPGKSNVAIAPTKNLQATFAFAQKHRNKSAEKQNAYYYQRAPHDKLQVGDKVFNYTIAKPIVKTGLRTAKHAQKEPTFKWVSPNQIKLDKNPMGFAGKQHIPVKS